MDILHLTTAADWAQALEQGEYRMSSRGSTLDDVGFIHASLPEQLQGVASVIYHDCDDPLVVLVLDDEDFEQAGIEVRYEDGGTGELFPHIYGPIGPALVRDARSAVMDQDGTLRF